MGEYCGPKSPHPLTPTFPLDNTTIVDEGIRIMRQAYYASTSWTDANVGKILDAFEENGFAWNNTVVVFWGDHGWHLGDNDQWAKMTNFEHATRIPLVISTPGGRTGEREPALVEAIDLFPTLVEEAANARRTAPKPFGLERWDAASSLTPLSACPVNHNQSRAVDLCTEGRSLSALLHDGHGGSGGSGARSPATWAAAFSQFPRPEHPNSKVDLECFNESTPLADCPDKMGYSIRVDT